MPHVKEVNKKRSSVARHKGLELSVGKALRDTMFRSTRQTGAARAYHKVWIGIGDEIGAARIMPFGVVECQRPMDHPAFARVIVDHFQYRHFRGGHLVDKSQARTMCVGSPILPSSTGQSVRVRGSDIRGKRLGLGLGLYIPSIGIGMDVRIHNV